MDPKNGTISRAMRNRCIEIVLFAIPVPSYDSTTLLKSIGVTSPEMISLMSTCHRSMSSCFPGLSIRDLQHWAVLVIEQQQRGNDVLKSLLTGMTQAYRRYGTRLEFCFLICSDVRLRLQIQSPKSSMNPKKSKL